MRGQYVAVIQIDGDEEGDGQPVAMQDLPKMVQAAEDEQPDGVLLDYDCDDEFGEPGDAEVVVLDRLGALYAPDEADVAEDVEADALDGALDEADDVAAPDAEPEPAEPETTKRRRAVCFDATPGAS